MNEREKRLFEFLVERHRAWSTSKVVTGDPSYGDGYDTAKQGCADDIDEFLTKEYPLEWAETD